MASNIVHTESLEAVRKLRQLAASKVGDQLSDMCALLNKCLQYVVPSA